MLHLVRVGAAVSPGVVTSTKLFVMRYNITSLASARLLARDTQFKLSSMVVTLLRRRQSLFTKRAACHCTFSTYLMFFTVDGSHTVEV